MYDLPIEDRSVTRRPRGKPGQEEETMGTYRAVLDGGNGGETTITATTIEGALAATRVWAREGDWDTSSGTIWVDVYVESEHGDRLPDHNVNIAPPEPPCRPLDMVSYPDTGAAEPPRSGDVDSPEGHRWRSPHSIVGGIRENPGVYGHGGGVTCAYVCTRCGCGKHTDSGAQNPDTGTQGLSSIAYRVGEYVAALTPPQAPDD